MLGWWSQWGIVKEELVGRLPELERGVIVHWVAFLGGFEPDRDGHAGWGVLRGYSVMT